MRAASLLGFALAAVLMANKENPRNCMSPVFWEDFKDAKLDASKWSLANPDLARVEFLSPKFKATANIKQHDYMRGILRLGFKMTPEGPRGAGITSLMSFHQYSLSRNRISPIYFEAKLRLNVTPGHRGVFRVRNHKEDDLPLSDLTFQGGAGLAYPWARLSSQGGTRDFPPSRGEDGYLRTPEERDGFNVYGIKWYQDRYDFFLNDFKVAQIDNPDPAKGFVISISHTAYESDRKNFDGKVSLDDIEVDWVRVFVDLN